MRRREPNSRVCGLEHRYWTDKAKEAPYEKPNKRAATLLLDPAELASAQAVAPRWRYTGNLNTPPRPDGGEWGNSVLLAPHYQTAAAASKREGLVAKM